MPLDAATFELAFFLCLVQVLASLPTEPYFHPWRSETEGEKVWGYPRGGGMGGQRNVSGRGEGVFGYGLGGRVGNVEEGGGVYPRSWFGAGGRSLEEAGEGYLSAGGYRKEPRGRQSYGNSYSSHVKCGEERGGTEKKRKNVNTNTEVGLRPPSGRKADERIDFEEGRSRQGGTSREMNPRIVTPKGGRRPSHGSSAKTDNKPANAISTTEKTSGPSRPRPGMAKPPGGDIIFPDGYPKKFVPRMTKCARKSTFCEHLGEEYPGEYISQVLEKEGEMFKEFFGQDVISDPNITERINAPEENSLCPYRQELVYPRAAQNTEDKWLYIVNQERFKQGVTVEVCLNPEDQCSLTNGFPLGYKPYCKQKYVGRRLVAVGENGKLLSDNFRLPSCCSCFVKHEISARMAPGVPSRAGYPLP